MRINDILAINQDTIPRTIARCRSYRNLVNQVFLGASTSTTGQIDDRIIEEECEEEEEEVKDKMVDDKPDKSDELNGKYNLFNYFIKDFNVIFIFYKFLFRVCI